ncbi:unnamed protein product [Microthlaspi erraticum]|uniref:Uncharacterized protein n=1 Tax=Microthlaspi erraticum TaxID=1685480 RepID=A0A6D2IV64_9BRAS|nr:unnamed protein product [Microthlaspi erraticum]
MTINLSTEVDRNLLRVSRSRATTDPAIFGSEQSNRDSRLTRSNSACGLDSVELELDFIFTSSSDSKQLDLDKDTWWARVSHLLFPENLFFYDAFRRGKESVADGKYGPHAKSKLDEEGLVNFRREYNIPDEIELVLPTESEGLEHVFWSILEHMGQGAWRDLAHGRSSTGSHLEDQLDRLLDQPVEFLNSTGQASTRSS